MLALAQIGFFFFFFKNPHTYANVKKTHVSGVAPWITRFCKWKQNTQKGAEGLQLALPSLCKYASQMHHP